MILVESPLQGCKYLLFYVDLVSSGVLLEVPRLLGVAETEKMAEGPVVGSGPGEGVPVSSTLGTITWVGRGAVPVV